MSKTARDALGDEAEPEGDEDPAAPVLSAGSGKKRRLKLIGFAAGAVLLAAGGGAAAYVTLFGDGREGGGDAAAVAAPTPVFYALPDLVVTLNGGDRKPRYLKVHVVLDLAKPADETEIERMTPRIVDYCQIFLRELRPEELRGSAAIIRMREELLKRINAAVAPVEVREVLFTDLFVE